jgi:hypothetical protein
MGIHQPCDFLILGDAYFNKIGQFFASGIRPPLAVFIPNRQTPIASALNPTRFAYLRRLCFGNDRIKFLILFIHYLECSCLRTDVKHNGGEHL